MGKVVLLGSSGFIGKNIFEYFSNAEMPIVAFNSNECNLLDYNEVEHVLGILDEDDTLIMSSSITRLQENTINSMNKNILMVQNIIKKLDKQKIKHFIFLSSIDVYGIAHNKQQITETTLLNPNDYYATSKVVSEYLLRTFCEVKNIKLSILRLSGVYGKHDYINSTIAKIIKNIIVHKSANIVGDGSLQRDYLFVDDLVNIIECIVKNELATTMNLATGKSISIKKLIQNIFFLLDIKESIVYSNNDEENNFMRPSDLNFDIGVLKKHLSGFEFTNIELALKKYILLFRKQDEH